MRRLSALGAPVALLAATALFASGCGGGATGVGLPTGPGAVSGIVTNTRGGPAIDGATVTASGTTATTNSQGAYSLSPLNPATYDVLAAKPGMAASKFQGVIVQAGQTTTANIIMRNVFDPTKPVSAPTIMVSGLGQGQTVTGPISFTVSVTASNPVKRIDVRAANMNALPQASVTDSSTAGPFTLNSTALANGSGFVDVIAYDLNQNLAEWVIGFTVNNAVTGTPPATPTGLALVAVTTGQSLNLFTAQRAQRFSTLGITQDPNILNVGGHSINLMTAPSNATLFVESTWNAQADAVGYRVFRSSSAMGPFIQVAERNSTFYDDADPSLTPGVAVYYQISAFNAGGQSAPTAAVTVTPLSAFNLNLASPANNATSVATLPTFSWTPTALVGTSQFYDIFVQGLNDPSPAWITTPPCSTCNPSIVNSTSIVYGTVPTVFINPLTNGKVYQWDIYEAVAQTIYSPNSIAVAIANRGLLGGPTGSLNGPFKLTTIQ